MVNKTMVFDLSQKVNVLIIGVVSSLLLLFMIYVAFAQFFLDYIEGVVDPDLNLSFLIIGMLFVSIFSSVIVSFVVVKNVKVISIIYASLLAYFVHFFLIIVVSYVSLFSFYPEAFEGLTGLDYLFVFPMTIVYFSIYVLDQFIYLFFISVIIYYIFFVIFLDRFYVPKKIRVKKTTNTKLNKRFM